MDDTPSHPGATLARQLLLAALALLAVLIAYDAARDVEYALRARMQWERHPAEVASTAYAQEVELEIAAALLPRLADVRQPEHATPHQPGHVRVLLAQPPYALYDVSDPVQIAFDPAQPGRVHIVDIGADAIPPLVKLVWLLALSVVAWLVLRARWGEDLTWLDGGWTPTALTALRAGSAATAEPGLSETRASHHGVLFWSALTGLIAVTGVGWVVLEYRQQPIEAGSMALGGLCFFGLALGTAVQTFSRRVTHDATGLADRTFFQTRRVPWKAIAGMTHVNLNEAAQQRYDRASKRSGSRPPTLMVWRIADAADAELLQLSGAMAPPEAFAALRQRIDAHLRASGALPLEDDEEVFDNEAQAWEHGGFASEEMAVQRSLWSTANRGVAIGLALMLLPFAAATAYATWNSLWFQFGAASATGTVVEKSAEGVPSVIVAYPLPDGRSLRTESDGSDLYADIALGDTLRVFYDPANPEVARIDLFLELWIGPMLLGALFLLVLLCAVLIGRSMTRPMAAPGVGKRP